MASVGSRSSVVTTAIRRPLVAQRRRTASRGRPAGRRQRDRIRDEPGRLGRPPRGGDARAPASQDPRHGLLDPGHRRGRERPAGATRPLDRVEADRREDVERHRAPDRGVQAIAELARPAAPHRVEVDERAVLVEDDDVDAGQVDRRPCARLQQRLRGGQRVGLVGHGVGLRTRQASGGNRRTTGAPAAGTARFGLLNVSTPTRRARRRWSSARGRPSPRKATSSTVAGIRLAPSPSPDAVERDHLGPDRDRDRARRPPRRTSELVVIVAVRRPTGGAPRGRRSVPGRRSSVPTNDATNAVAGKL